MNQYNIQTSTDGGLTLFSLLSTDFFAIKDALVKYPTEKTEKDKFYLAMARFISGAVIFSGFIQLKNSVTALPREGNLFAVAWAIIHLVLGSDLFKISKNITDLLNTYIEKDVPVRILTMGTLNRATTNPPSTPAPGFTPTTPKPNTLIPTPLPPANPDGKSKPVPPPLPPRRKTASHSTDRSTTPTTIKIDTLPRVPATPHATQENKPIGVTPNAHPETQPPQKDTPGAGGGQIPPPVARPKIKVLALDQLCQKPSLEIAMELAKNTIFYALWISTQNFWAKRTVTFFSNPII